MHLRVALAAVILALAATFAMAEGIEPGLWRIISRTETGGVIGPPHESSKCLTSEEVHDLPTTFSPVPRTVNSTCAPIERSFTGEKLTWRLVCKGQLDMELTGDFTFDSPHHYSATVRTKASMAGMQMVDSQNTLEGRWVSDCK
ncbi:MAG TPA: DUF3617 family protein [Xanthobacteraceae bacterium]|nr:DUF3617 family protein [Xanthobacteraceae bacterium]